MKGSIPPCPICNGGHSEMVGRHRSQENDIAYTLYECTGCSLGYCQPLVPANSAHYREFEWYGERWEFQRVFELTKLRDGTILEIGCGEGHFIMHANKWRNHVVGIDFNDEVIDRCIQRGLNGEFICMDSHALATSWRSDEKFDMVACYHVIEHMENLHEFLRYCKKVLTENGLLVFSTPNRARANIYFKNREWWDYPPHHLTWWSEKAARRVLERLGFEPVNIESEPLYFSDIHRNVITSTLSILPEKLRHNPWIYRAAFYLMMVRSALLYLSSSVSKVISGNTLLVIAKIKS